MKDNIIQFKKNKSELPNTKEEADSRILEVRTAYARGVSEIVIQSIVNELQNYGFQIKLEDSNLKDLVMLTEQLNAVMFRYIGTEHFLHDVADNLIELEGEEAKLSKMIRDIFSEENEE